MPPKKKILYVITKSNWGGAQRYVYDLATNLPKEKFEVIVALGGTGGKSAEAGLLQQRLLEANIRTVFVKSFVRDVSFAKELSTYSELVEIFRREKPDVIHLNSSKAGGIGSFAARIAGVKNIIFTVHGWPFLEQRNIFARSGIWFASWLSAIMCHKVIVISDFEMKIAKRMPFVSHKLVRIYNGMPPLVHSSGEIIRAAFPHGVVITGTIGELNKNKNQQALIEEAKRKQNMYVAIVGEGEERANLEEKIKKYGLMHRVKLFGFVPASEALKGFDIFALPSLKEGLPYALLEAKAAGLPIVANRIGGIAEILDAKDMSDFSLEKMLEKTTALY
jgi:glycosyltransferase involved in cell wall biosynthesis